MVMVTVGASAPYVSFWGVPGALEPIEDIVVVSAIFVCTDIPLCRLNVLMYCALGIDSHKYTNALLRKSTRTGPNVAGQGGRLKIRSKKISRVGLITPILSRHNRGASSQ